MCLWKAPQQSWLIQAATFSKFLFSENVLKTKAEVYQTELDFGYAASDFAFAFILTILIILQVK